MLRSLAITDFVLIPKLEIEFGPGLTVITGETGVGKSVLLQAVRLLLGDRADAGAVRAGADRAVIEAVFDPPGDHPARAALSERGYEPADELPIRRTVAARPGARGQASIDGRTATAAILREIAAGLVAVSGSMASPTPRSATSTR